MAFDPNNYKAPEVKKLPVILLLDVSGSMQGAKIDSLYNATCDMIDTFVGAQLKEQSIDVAIITFGKEIKLHTPYTPVKELQDKGLEHFIADGMTPMGTAIQMAKDMIDDKSVTPSRIYRPAVVLVSDGEPMMIGEIQWLCLLTMEDLVSVSVLQLLLVSRLIVLY